MMATPSRQAFASDYNDVNARLVEFREKHPDGSLQQLSLEFREVANCWWVIYTAAAYRAPDDLRPGHGTAWEPVPGATPFTRGSEVQNAETSAWGRAIVAALAADTKKGIATAEEVRGAQERRDAVPAEEDPWAVDPATALKNEIRSLAGNRAKQEMVAIEWEKVYGHPLKTATDVTALTALRDQLRQERAA